RIAAEVEWFLHDVADCRRTVRADEVLAALGGGSALPSGGRVSIEPGGQLEVSTPPFTSVDALCDAIDDDEVALGRRLQRCGLVLRAAGFDGQRPPVRSVSSPRYDQMEAWFLAHCPEGAEMMCSTASLQVNVDFVGDPRASFARAVELAGDLAATYNDAPRRMAAWRAIDAARGARVPTCAAAWDDYVLDTAVFADARGRTLRQLGDVGDDVVARHVSTLFPPVRPRGYLEIRTIDAQPASTRRAVIADVWSRLRRNEPNGA
ncbi:MAG TPA: glutamate-cysteine ligase family protein, partial [Acidimicrobiales bacterium]|nr:glutamate-cysteine ligase family protein [Acidimicrobiales bacterium]